MPIIFLLAGAGAGLVQLTLLGKFTRRVTDGKMDGKAVGLGLIQMFMPFAILALVAVFASDLIIWVGCGIAGALVVGGIIKFLLLKKKLKNERDREKGSDE
ncbi:MAG: hypothetical protein LBN30_10885 [Oscillospiraceae bacterium]|nr:hypothetical protein [Oscillospiraceae bacterium]